MSDNPTRCLGRDSDNNQCICKRATETEVVEGRTVCCNCGHIESAHPEPVGAGAGALIKKFQAAGKLPSSTPSTSAPSGSKPKATIVEAKSETNANLTKKRKSKTDTEPPVNAKKAKQIKAEVILSSVFPIMVTHDIFSLAKTTRSAKLSFLFAAPQ
ncbi:hypothetical protein B0H16DRAFT_1533079 [Mycena metata]|uniref:Uncharacterized protein n=1 Tax=Mycena metata TaxID=1033252 RepID=A0AAD7JCU7_9AGAR|nr:hypothetical protein B0H16DRAFT_1533079 [Mycena metata]